MKIKLNSKFYIINVATETSVEYKALKRKANSVFFQTIPLDTIQL